MSTSIEWTDQTWNPTVGCSRVSKGCERCYAERVAHRGMSEAHRGLTVMGNHGPRWTGEVRLMPDRLDQPLRWRKPRRVFVNSMSDLFHEGVSFEYIAAVFGVMAASPRHTFQVLTKRPERAAEFFAWLPNGAADCSSTEAVTIEARRALFNAGNKNAREALAGASNGGWRQWPLPNVWIGVSVEDQATADERIPALLNCPAAVRWVSYEPAIGAVDFKDISTADPMEIMLPLGGVTWRVSGSGTHLSRTHAELDWIVVGGESGPGARPFDVQWARSTIQQCREASVPCFWKQAGSHLVIDGVRVHLPKKGGRIEDLERLLPDVGPLREFPRAS